MDPCPRRRRGRIYVLVIATLFLAGCGSTQSRPRPSSVPAAKATTATDTTPSQAAQAAARQELRSLPQAASAADSGPVPSSTATPVDRAFLRAVFDDAQRFWSEEFKPAGLRYSPARLTIFDSNVRSACGNHEDAGPFYCGADHTVYLSVQWFAALAREHRVGSFAQAYIVGHELGHHVQRLLGIDVGAAVHVNPGRRNALSRAGELQADCLAGVWARSAYTRAQLSATELDDMLKKAEVIGDDFEARAAGETVDPGLSTHGSSEQRQHWLRTGFDSGRPTACDTFAGLVPIS
jgi:predicted metalloprotease